MYRGNCICGVWDIAPPRSVRQLPTIKAGCQYYMRSAVVRKHSGNYLALTSMFGDNLLTGEPGPDGENPASDCGSILPSKVRINSFRPSSLAPHCHRGGSNHVNRRSLPFVMAASPGVYLPVPSTLAPNITAGLLSGSRV